MNTNPTPPRERCANIQCKHWNRRTGCTLFQGLAWKLCIKAIIETPRKTRGTK